MFQYDTVLAIYMYGSVYWSKSHMMCCMYAFTHMTTPLTLPLPPSHTADLDVWSYEAVPQLHYRRRTRHQLPTHEPHSHTAARYLHNHAVRWDVLVRPTRCSEGFSADYHEGGTPHYFPWGAKVRHLV